MDQVLKGSRVVLSMALAGIGVCLPVTEWTAERDLGATILGRSASNLLQGQRTG